MAKFTSVLISFLLLFTLCACEPNPALEPIPTTSETTIPPTTYETLPTEPSVPETTRELTDEDRYENAVSLYDSGNFADALELFEQIPDYENVPEYIENCSVMLKFQGVFDSQYSKYDYYVIDGWNFTDYTIAHDSFMYGDKITDEVFLFTMDSDDGEGKDYFLVDTLYKDKPEEGLIYYALLEEEGLKCVTALYPTFSNAPTIPYLYNDAITPKEVDDLFWKEYNRPVPQIGMTQEEVLNSKWGSPERKNKTTTKYGVSEQWVYSNDRYVYFENGIVTAIQEY